MATSAGRVLLIPKGDYSPNVTYDPLDYVFYQRSTYVAKRQTTGNLPTNTTYWQILAQGTDAVFTLVVTDSDDSTDNTSYISNGNVYLNLVDDGTVVSSHRLKGLNGIAVTRDNDDTIRFSIQNNGVDLATKVTGTLPITNGGTGNTRGVIQSGAAGNTIGGGATAEGTNNTVTGSYCHAEGSGNTVSGNYAHAEGTSNTASGGSSHAEGASNNTASGQGSHAEGTNTTASGNYSHAEGWQTVASAGGNAFGSAHAEGMGSEAQNRAAHAEGNYTVASGEYSHAEGGNTTASGTGSHAEGQSTNAQGEYSHADGYSTLAQGSYSHASGYNTTAASAYQFVCGKNTPAVVSGNQIFMIGIGSSASSPRVGFAVNESGTPSSVNALVTTSDRNKKHDIFAIDETLEKIFLDTPTCTYYLNTGDRRHIGTIAQDVEEVLNNYGVTPEEFAPLCKDQKLVSKVYDENDELVTEFETDEDGLPIMKPGYTHRAEEVFDENGNPVYDYSFRYEEYIMLTVHMVQKLYAMVEAQQAEIEQLKTQLNNA